jgi:hypothetical protein
VSYAQDDLGELRATLLQGDSRHLSDLGTRDRTSATAGGSVAWQARDRVTLHCAAWAQRSELRTWIEGYGPDATIETTRDERLGVGLGAEIAANRHWTLRAGDRIEMVRLLDRSDAHSLSASSPESVYLASNRQGPTFTPNFVWGVGYQSGHLSIDAATGRSLQLSDTFGRVDVALSW